MRRFSAFAACRAVRATLASIFAWNACCFAPDMAPKIETPVPATVASAATWMSIGLLALVAGYLWNRRAA